MNAISTAHTRKTIRLSVMGCFMGALVAVLLGPLAQLRAQPIADSVKAMQLRNEKLYRQLNAYDDKGASYEYTNVTTWKITDDELRNQILAVLKSTSFGDKRLKDIDVNNIYVFNAPVPGTDRFEPFHILVVGKRVKTDTSGGDIEDPFGFGGGRKRNTGQDQYIAFKGKEVIRLMVRQPALADNLNAIQGEIYELPGEIMPRGVQLVKNSTQRYIFHQMFTGFYSKRQMVDEQRRVVGMPTSDEEFIPDSNAVNAPDDPELSASQALPDEVISSRAFRYEKIADLALDHVNINLSRNMSVGVQLGNPETALPFWTSGLGRAWLTLKNQIGRESDFKIGLVFPSNLGREDQGIFNKRNLSGGFGGSVDAYFAGLDFFSAFNMPLQFGFTVLPPGGSNRSIIYNGGPITIYDKFGQPFTYDKSFYRTSFMGQLAVPIIVQLDPYSFLQFSAGVGIHNVYQSWVATSDTITSASDQLNGQQVQHVIAHEAVDKVQDLIRVSTPFTPHVSIEFVNHRMAKFGVNMLYDHLFTFGGWIELWEDHLRIETSYTTALVRDPKPYEPKSFFYVTPRIYF